MDGDVPQPNAGMCSSANPANALPAFDYAIVTNANRTQLQRIPAGSGLNPGNAQRRPGRILWPRRRWFTLLGPSNSQRRLVPPARIARKGSAEVPAENAWVARDSVTCCKRWPAICGRPQVQGESVLYAIRARGCVTQFTHGEVFHRRIIPDPISLDARPAPTVAQRPHHRGVWSRPSLSPDKIDKKIRNSLNSWRCGPDESCRKSASHSRTIGHRTSKRKQGSVG